MNSYKVRLRMGYKQIKYPLFEVVPPDPYLKEGKSG